jgi:hydroxymethylbilane synthase
MTRGSLLRIATRQSQLALWQAGHVAALLCKAHPGVAVELVPMTTRGDQILDRSLAAIGGKGLFIKELEIAIAEGRADLAVHSMKDVPAELPPGFVIGAALERANAHDALLSTRYTSLAQLPPGARVGTSSLRRQAQLLALRPDLQIEGLRGNVGTRLKRLDDGGLDAIVLACAGLVRLGLESRITVQLDIAACLPAVGQGIIGVECHADNASALALLAVLEHPASRAALRAERAFSGRLGGSCQSPIAAHASIANGQLDLHGLVAEPDGSRLLRDQLAGNANDPEAIGDALAQRLLAAGAGPLLERLRVA